MRSCMVCLVCLVLCSTPVGSNTVGYNEFCYLIRSHVVKHIKRALKLDYTEGMWPVFYHKNWLKFTSVFPYKRVIFGPEWADSVSTMMVVSAHSYHQQHTGVPSSPASLVYFVGDLISQWSAGRSAMVWTALANGFHFAGYLWHSRTLIRINGICAILLMCIWLINW